MTCSSPALRVLAFVLPCAQGSLTRGDRRYAAQVGFEMTNTIIF